MKRFLFLIGLSVAFSVGAQELFTGKILKQNGGWCWYQDERALQIGDEVIFSSVKSPEGDIDISSWNIKTGEVKTQLMDEKFNSDDHAEPALLKLDDGRILAAWSSHGNAFDKSRNGKMYYAKTKSGSDITNWEPTKTNEPRHGCYNNLYKLSAENGRIYNFSRSIGYNPNWYYSDDNGESFKYGGRFIIWKFDPKDPKKTPMDGNRPYAKYISDGVSKIHFTVTEDHPRAYDNSIYYGYMKDGKMFKSGDVEVCKLSQTNDAGPKPTEFTRIFEGDADNVAWTMEMNLDKSGNPVVIFSVQKDHGYLRHLRGHETHDLRYFYARFDGTNWHVNQMAFAGTALYLTEADYTGLCAIDPQNVNVVYISTSSDPVTNKPLLSTKDGLRHYEIFKGTTNDLGKTWAWEAVTKNSNCDNIRPIIPIPDGKEKAPTVLLWLRGKLTTFIDYKLDIAGKVIE